MDKMFGPIIRNTLQIPGIIDSTQKGKNIRKSLLNARYNLGNNKIVIKPSALLRGSRLKSNKREYVAKLTRSLVDRGIFLKGATKKILVKKEDFSIFNIMYLNL